MCCIIVAHWYFVVQHTHSILIKEGGRLTKNKKFFFAKFVRDKKIFFVLVSGRFTNFDHNQQVVILVQTTLPIAVRTHKKCSTAKSGAI